MNIAQLHPWARSPFPCALGITQVNSLKHKIPFSVSSAQGIHFIFSSILWLVINSVDLLPTFILGWGFLCLQRLAHHAQSLSKPLLNAATARASTPAGSGHIGTALVVSSATAWCKGHKDVLTVNAVKSQQFQKDESNVFDHTECEFNMRLWMDCMRFVSMMFFYETNHLCVKVSLMKVHA